MDLRVLFVGLVLVLLCGQTNAGLVGTAIVIGDDTIDITGRRAVGITARISITASGGPTNPEICVGSVSPADANWAFDNIVDVDASATTSVQKVFIHTTATAACPLTGTFTINYDMCADAGATVVSTSFMFTLQDRSFCSDTSYRLAPVISSFGAFADAAFSHTKSQYLINDVVYFPFQATYNDITIATLTFNTISVQANTDGSSPVTLYSTVSPVSGTIVQLQTSAPISQLSSGTAIIWFSLQLNRESGSPFANAASSATSYTFSAVFDITYKNAKRELHVEEGQLRSEATIKLVNKEAPPVLLPSPNLARPQEVYQLPTGAASSLQYGVVGSAVLLLFVTLFGF